MWYRLNITLDDIAGFRLHVAEENAAQTRATVQLAMPTGQSWRFHHWTYSGVATLDTYNEYFGPKYTYDAGTNGVGQRTAMTLHTPEVGTLASTSWASDTRGRTTGATHHVKGLSGGRTFTWTYDSADRVVTQLFPAAGSAAAETLTYSYDSGWRQTQVCTSLGGCYAQGAAYEVSGQLDHLTLGNSLVQNWMYDSLNRLVRLQLGTSGSVNTADNLNAGAADRFDRQYAYDAVGNITTLTDKRGGVTERYRYDAAGARYKRVRGSTTVLYREGVYEETVGGPFRRSYMLNGQVVAVRERSSAVHTVH